MNMGETPSPTHAATDMATRATHTHTIGIVGSPTHSDTVLVTIVCIYFSPVADAAEETARWVWVMTVPALNRGLSCKPWLKQPRIPDSGLSGACSRSHGSPRSRARIARAAIAVNGAAHTAGSTRAGQCSASDAPYAACATN